MYNEYTIVMSKILLPLKFILSNPEPSSSEYDSIWKWGCTEIIKLK